MTVVSQNINHFLEEFELVNIKKGMVLLRPEDAITSIFYVKKGSVRMYAITPTGEEITLHIFRENSYFPIMLVLSEKENQYYFEALEDAQLNKVAIDKVVGFLKSNPDELFVLTKRFADAIVGLTKRIEELSFTNAETKVFNLLSYFSQKFGEKDENGITITIPLRHEDIANWLGLTRETVSRNLEKMQKEGVILIAKSKITIL